MFRKAGYFIGTVLLSIFSSCHSREKKASHYLDGKIKYSYQMQAGKQEGIAKAYLPSGILESQVSWKNGKQDGPAAFYYPNGTLKSTSTWKAGGSYGLSKAFFEDGTLKQSFFQDTNGNLESLHEYYSNGKVKRFVKISKAFKTVILFDSAGKPLEKQLKNSDGILLYVRPYDKKSQERPGIVMPIFQNETDTILWGGTYSAVMHLGLKVDRNIRLAISSIDKLRTKADTISFIPGREGEAFHITMKPSHRGQNKFFFKFICFGCKSDTLHINGETGSSSYFVKSE